jgi:hypothetical protein
MTTKFPSPFPKKVKLQIASQEGEFKNENLPESQFGINLITEKNTPVQAIKDGIIFKIKNDSKRYGLKKELKDQANYIVIDHGDETFTEYSHLSKKVPIRIGQKIKAGELIGYTGLSGYMKTPNLYLNLFKVEEGKPISLPFELKKPRTQEDLAKIAGMIFILSLGAILIFLSGITGSVIGKKPSSPYILIPVALAVISGIIWILIKRKQSKLKPAK